MTTFAGSGFWPLRIAPAQHAYRVGAEQTLRLYANIKLLHRHIVQHLTDQKSPSPKCVLCITALCALAPSAAGMRLADTGRMAGSSYIEDDFLQRPLLRAIYSLGPGPALRPSQSHSIDTDTLAEARHICRSAITEELHDTQTPTKACGEIGNDGLWSHELPQPHELPDPHIEDVGGGFALRRVMTETLSEYMFTSGSSMPSPRLGAL